MFNEIFEKHEKILSEMDMPKWLNLDCPLCSAKLPLRSIREFGVKLNARNLCDLFVIIHCDDCKKMETIYFRKEIDKIPDFIAFLNGEKSPKSEPIIEKEMLNLRYNNLIEIAFL